MDFELDVRRYIIENFLLGDDSGLSAAQSLLATGIVDSTGIMELVLFLEEKYGIQVADQEMLPENLDSISNIAAFLIRKLAVRQPVSQVPSE